MKTIAIGLAAILVPVVANAQQHMTPSQIALQMNGVISNWALTLERQQAMIENLQKQVADLRKQIENAKHK